MFTGAYSRHGGETQEDGIDIFHLLNPNSIIPRIARRMLVRSIEDSRKNDR